MPLTRPPPPGRGCAARRRSAGSAPLSVTTTSTSASSANRTVCSRPILEESTSTTTRWALATIARLAAASVWSGVLSPWSTESPLVPMKATSARSRDSASTVSSPTAAWVVERTRPGSRWRFTLGDPASRAAIGTALVTTVSCRSRGSIIASRAVVVPASSSTLPPVDGSSPTAFLAIRSFSSAWARSRSPTFASSAVRAAAGTAPPCTRRSTPARSRTERSRRTVSVVTAYSAASAFTDSRPRWATRSAMAC